METIQDLILYYSQNSGYVWTEFYRHFLMSAYGVFFAALVAIPLGVLIARYSRLSGVVLTITNVIQTIPALAMLAVLMLVLGLGANTVVLALFLYSLLPILRNTYTGIKNVDRALVESGRAMGMTRWQLLYMLELPLALSVITAGLRTALVFAIGITTIGTFIGAGGLGDIVIRGTNATDGTAIILAGAIPTALMAILADVLMGWIERTLSPSSKQQKQANPV
ncbi:ABC transporter permease [Alkalicoccobacillus gibsonii]|uniref:ABC transporter permease n=1 Tax=Alkalicoccobacillus gibsonii TaxID=79881 RepID=UPI0019326174|nr:ABC transporter permease [Alkalicoccobacillus gibsonii]MBM0064512.1 ABC transporter permease [Alkalicoccobacillus gibsonii]